MSSHQLQVGPNTAEWVPMITTDIIPSPPPLHKPPPKICLFSWNVRGIGGKGSQVAATKNHYISALTSSESFSADFIFLQECNFPEAPNDYFSRRLPQYRAHGTAGHPPGSPAPRHDSVILVRSSFTASTLLADFSWSRVTTVLLPDLGIALINIHGPPFASPTFFHRLHDPLLAFQSKGWSLILAGDFNVAPLPCNRTNVDRSTAPAALNELMDTLALTDLGDHLNPHSPSPLATAAQSPVRSPLLTFKSTSLAALDRADPLGYRSHIDLVFCPADVASHRNTNYSAMDQGDHSDHKALCITLAWPTASDCRFTRAGYRIPPAKLANKKYARDIRGILAGFKDPPMPTDTTPQDPFTAFAAVKADLIHYFKSAECKEDHFHLKELATLRKRHTKLSRSAPSAPDQHAASMQLQDLEEQALATANFAAAKVQIAAAKKWVKLGDHVSPWSTLLVRTQTKPRNNKPIVALTPDPADPSYEVTSDAEITAAMGDFYCSMYEPTMPDPDALEELLALHKCFLNSHPVAHSNHNLELD
ncbi:hypothetical protein H4219_006039 [Mycoemilia scoparia]|uniref:Endonuclease/exonuclease/phosphatase domain-containing protein n=1 Tax=Mycoemilia scoparia TaxID=417184 RepID=A0A9W8DJT8_9FUNG|nr:hypothetical protein H4219_006039 [Mycoemilia scoparia]